MGTQKVSRQLRSTRLFIFVILFTLLYTVVTSIISFYSTNKAFVELDKELTRIFSNALGKTILEQMLFSDPAVLQQVVSSLVEETIVFAYIQNRQGELLVHTFVPLIPKEILANISPAEPQKELNTHTFGKILVTSIPLYYGNLGYIVIGQKYPDLSPLWLKIGASVTILLLVYIIAFQIFLRKQTAMEKKINEKSVQIQQKNQEMDQTNDELKKKNSILDEKVRQLKLSEERALQANQAKSVFLSSMSHELRTPLNAIIGFSQLMETEFTPNSQQKKNLNIILNSGKHLLNLINNILSITKIEEGRIILVCNSFSLSDLIQSLENICSFKAQEKKLQLLFELDPRIPQMVLGDEGKLRQVLINLVSNSIKFTEHGSVRLKIQKEEEERERIIFSVIDTGIGISEEDQQKLFQSFVQTASGLQSQEGTGLGLVISNSFVNLMGGKIQVKSEFGRGSTFSFIIELPTSEASLIETDTKRVIGLKSGQPEYRLLIVDDKENNRELLKRIFSPLGFQVGEANNGEEAIEQWKSFHPDLIWMDLRMPKLDGYEATFQIRMQEKASNTLPEKKIPIIALTASAFEHDRAAIFAAGCSDFVAKPFQKNELFTILKEHLGVQFKTRETLQKISSPEKLSKADRLTSLTKIPKELLEKLQNALEIGDNPSAQQIVRSIEKTDLDLAASLENKIQKFEIDEILEEIKKGLLHD
ncbi:MAG: ATP-binding protein [Planctomycetota bacterium]